QDEPEAANDAMAARPRWKQQAAHDADVAMGRRPAPVTPPLPDLTLITSPPPGAPTFQPQPAAEAATPRPSRPVPAMPPVVAPAPEAASPVAAAPVRPAAAAAPAPAPAPVAAPAV